MKNACAACGILQEAGFTVKCNDCIAKEEGGIHCTECGRRLPGFAAIQHGGKCSLCFNNGAFPTPTNQ
jgi:hypothetical protein